MSKLKCINGFTKKKMIAVIKREFKGKSFIDRSNGITCAYRGEDGTKCAVGMFIPDNLYHSAMDSDEAGTTIQHIVNLSPKLKQVLPLNIKALEEFQTIHDQLENAFSNDEQKQELIDWIERRVK